MVTIRLLVDSTCDIPIEQLKSEGIYFVPLYVMFGNDQYLDMVELSSENFFKKLVDSKVHLTTSQPSPQEFFQVYEKARDEGVEILYSLIVSSKLSGTFQSATIARRTFNSMYDDMEIILTDSLGATGHQGISALTLNDLIKRGASLEEIETGWDQIKERTILAAAIDTLRYLRRGGRVGTLKSIIGKVLNLKPMLTIINGEIISFGSARGLASAMDDLIIYGKKFFDPDEPVRAFIGHSIRYELIEPMKKMVMSSFNIQKIDELIIGSAIGVHIGPGAIGYVIQPYLE